MFDIRFVASDHAGLARGVLQIGEFSEGFAADVSCWTPLQYRESWARAAHRIAVEGSGQFLTSIGGGNLEQSIFWAWPCWRVGDVVKVQNHLIRMPTDPPLRAPGDAEAIDRDLREINEDGDTVSMWVCDFADIVAFAGRLSLSARG